RGANAFETWASALHQGICLLDADAQGDHRMVLGPPGMLDAGGEHERPIGQQHHSGIAAIADPLGMTVEELDAVVPALAGLDVLIAPHPSHKVALRGTLRGHVAEGENPAPIRECLSNVPVAAESPRRVPRLAPAFPLV